MGIPVKAIFAFNANIDHLKSANEEDIAKIGKYSPQIASQLSECFSWGMQKEIAIDQHGCEFFLSSFRFDSKMVGGQAGNAAEQASALGVESFLHSNFANPDLLQLFSRQEKILVADENGFFPAASAKNESKSAHHFVFENTESHTRFIASYDPFPLHPEDNFCRHIEKELPQINKAFIGGLHLVKTPDRMRKFLSEMKKWKELNPKLQMFLEMGEFQSRDVLKAVQDEVFPFVDMVGLNEAELGSLGYELEELAEHAASVLFHTAEESRVIPESKTNAAALEFARRCASFFAENCRRATQDDIRGYDAKFIPSPARIVGLGDTFSCAYFMSI